MPSRGDLLSDTAVRRVALAGCAGLLLTVPVLIHDTLNGRLALGWICVAAGLALAAVALRRTTHVPRRAGLLGLALCAALALSTVVILVTTLASPEQNLRCRDDVAAATFGSAQELRAGHNPYQSYDSLRIQSGWDCPQPAATILRRGRFASDDSIPPESQVRQAVRDAIRDPSRPEVERNLNYPGGTVLLGLAGTQAFPPLLALLLVAAAVLVARRATTRTAAAVALAAQIALVSLVPDGHTDAAVVALLLVAWSRPTTTQSGLALGLACGTKQTAWFLAPAFLATAYARGGRPALVKTTAATVAGFALLNLPFIVMGPGAWLHGVMGPLVDGLFPLGAGLIGLVTSGTVPVSLTPLFSALMLAAVAASVAAALRYDRVMPGIGAIIGALALFLGPRSLLEYMAGWGVLLVCVVATAPRAKEPNARESPPTARPARAAGGRRRGPRIRARAHSGRRAAERGDLVGDVEHLRPRGVDVDVARDHVGDGDADAGGLAPGDPDGPGVAGGGNDMEL